MKKEAAVAQRNKLGKGISLNPEIQEVLTRKKDIEEHTGIKETTLKIQMIGPTLI